MLFPHSAGTRPLTVLEKIKPSEDSDAKSAGAEKGERRERRPRQDTYTSECVGVGVRVCVCSRSEKTEGSLGG